MSKYFRNNSQQGTIHEFLEAKKVNKTKGIFYLIDKNGKRLLKKDAGFKYESCLEEFIEVVVKMSSIVRYDIAAGRDKVCKNCEFFVFPMYCLHKDKRPYTQDSDCCGNFKFD